MAPLLLWALLVSCREVPVALHTHASPGAMPDACFGIVNIEAELDKPDTNCQLPPRQTQT